MVHMPKPNISLCWYANHHGGRQQVCVCQASPHPLSMAGREPEMKAKSPYSSLLSLTSSSVKADEPSKQWVQS